MAVIQRHWKTLLFLQALVLLALAGGVYYFTPRPVQAQQQTAAPAPAAPAQAPLVAPSDRVTYTHIQTLRRELYLENYDLAAIGCDGGTTAHVLGALVNWYQANAAAVDQNQAARIAARRNLQATIRSINVGPKNDGVIASVPNFQQQIAAAEAVHQTVLASAAAAASAALMPAQQTVWATGRANARLPQRYRYLANVTAAQTAALTQGRGQDAALQRAEASLLSASQQTQLNATLASVQANLVNVSATAAQLLPGPPPPPNPLLSTTRPAQPVPASP